MAMKAAPPFDPKTLLSKVGDGRSIGKYRLSKQEARILQRLGAAVLLRWNDLPTHVQRQLFEHSVVGVEQGQIALLKEQIARFLHKHKDDNRERD